MADYVRTAAGVIEAVGGADNVRSLVHCATRLRFALKDRDKADAAAVEKVPGVMTTSTNASEFQVVIGSEVSEVFDEVNKLLPESNAAGGSRGPAEDETGKKENIFSRLVAMISAIFSPLIWTLAAVGLLKALVSSSVTFGWLDNTGTTYAMLNALSDGFIYFLPFALAISAAKYFDAQQFTSLAIAGAALYPALADLIDAPGVVFFGVPTTIVGYAYTVVPIIVAVWLQSHLERVLYAKLPAMIRRFFTPMIVLSLLVPFVFLAIGPLATFLTGGVADGINWVFQTVPWLGGAIMGGAWQILTIFGLHSGFTPFFVTEYQEYGFGRLLAPLWAAVLGQTAAAAGVWVRSRNTNRKALAGSATVSGLLAGVTEPAIYGVNLPLRRPFIFGVLGGIVGGAVISGADVAINAAIVLPSALSIPALTGNGSFLFAIVGVLLSMAIAFTLTVLFGVKEPAEEPGQGDDPVHASNAEILSPLDGVIKPLHETPDAAFAEGKLGAGSAIIPSGNAVFSPFDGEVVVVMPSGHAIGLRHPGGAEVLIHLGLDTVKLKGKHFTVAVEKGQQVTAGQMLVEFDREAIEAAGYDLTTPVVVTNSAQYPMAAPLKSGPVKTGERLFTVAAPVTDTEEEEVTA